jgi:hypothetical protein
MIRVNVLGRACAALALLAFVVLVYRLHSLASRLEQDLQLRTIARDMLREDEHGSQPLSPPAPPHAAGSRHTDESAQQSTAEQTRAAGGQWAELEELHRDWDMYVVNLDKRPDRLACTMQEFNRLGMRVNRLRGVDGTQLNLEQLSFVGPEAHTPESVSTCCPTHMLLVVSCAGQTGTSVALT